jgi:hypothetical protein
MLGLSEPKAAHSGGSTNHGRLRNRPHPRRRYRRARGPLRRSPRRACDDSRDRFHRQFTPYQCDTQWRVAAWPRFLPIRASGKSASSTGCRAKRSGRNPERGRITRGCRKRLAAVLAAPGLEPCPGSPVGQSRALGARSEGECLGGINEVLGQRQLAQSALDARRHQWRSLADERVDPWEPRHVSPCPITELSGHGLGSGRLVPFRRCRLRPAGSWIRLRRTAIVVALEANEDR